jgi:hypothetical protein
VGEPARWIQSQFYFLAGFSLLAIHGLLSSRSFSIAWFCGLGAAALACVSMGSGMLLSIPIGLAAILRVVARDRGGDVRFASVTLIVALTIGVVGWQFRPTAPWHEPLRGSSAGEITAYAMRCLAWPVYKWPATALLLWAPWTVLAIRRLTSRGFAAGGSFPNALPTVAGSTSLPVWRASNATSDTRGTKSERWKPSRQVMDSLLAAGLWVVLQALAVSYSRAGASSLPASRYGDIFALGLVVNFLSLAVLAGGLASTKALGAERTLPGAANRLWFAATAVWLAAVIGAVAIITITEFQSNLPRKKNEFAAYERNVRAFVLTDDYTTFREKDGALPFPDPDWLARIIRHPTLRALLPASVREPILVPNLGNDSLHPNALPELLNRRTRAVVLGSRWKSTVIPPGVGWWKIETAGDVGQAGATLALVSERGEHVSMPIAPSKPAGNSWRAAYVPAPKERSVLVAAVSEPANWIAFSDPIKMSSLSYRVWRVTQHAHWAAVVAAILLIVSSVRPTIGAFDDRDLTHAK